MGAAVPIIGIALSVGGTALAFKGQREQLKAQERASKLNAAQAARNARLIETASIKEAKKTLKEGETLKSTQKTLFGKAGVALTGSALDVLAETQRVTLEDAEAILLAGKTGSEEELFRATQFAEAGRAARKTRGILPLATLLSGTGSVLGQSADLFEKPRTAKAGG
jgi:hypothetical protein